MLIVVFYFTMTVSVQIFTSNIRSGKSKNELHLQNCTLNLGDAAQTQKFIF